MGSFPAFTFTVLAAGLLLLCQVESQSERSKREVSAAEKEMTAIVEKKAAELPMSELAVGGIYFTQKVDKANSMSKYFLAEEEVYVRDSNDGGKDVIVFSSAEDKLPSKKLKRIFVVMKKVQDNIYYAFTAFVRDAAKADTEGTVSVGGKNRFIEWSYYNDHVIQGHSLTSLSSSSCMSSIILSCVFNYTAIPESVGKGGKPYVPKLGSQADRDAVDKLPVVPGDGSDADDNADLFQDFEMYKFEGRGVGDVLGVGLVPGILSGTSAVLCGVLAIVGICGHGKGSTELTVINESGVPMDPATMQAIANGRIPPPQGYPGGAPPGYPGQGPPPGYPGQGQGPPPGYPGRRKRETTPALTGWKTQYEKVTKGIYSTKEADTPFFGFGNCPFVKPDPSTLKSDNITIVMDYYLAALRLQCLESSFKKLVIVPPFSELFKLNADKSVNFVASHEVVAKAKIGINTFFLLTTGLEIEAAAAVLMDAVKEANNAATRTASDGKRKISKSVSTLVDMYLKLLQNSRKGKETRKWLVAVTRYSELVLKKAFIKLAQDAQALDECSDCGEDKETNKNDRAHVAAILIFLKRGFSMDEREEQIGKAFKEFYSKNTELFDKYVSVYS